VRAEQERWTQAHTVLTTLRDRAALFRERLES
jgi:hypothetical protein